MDSTSPLRVGILAGGGSLPREVALSVIARGGHVHVVAIEGEVTQNFDGLAHTFVRWGEVGRITGDLRRAACTHLVIIGSARRPDLGRIRPDLGFFLALPAVLRSIAAGGDDALLRAVIGHFERQGLSVIGPADVAPELLVGRGPMGQVAPQREDETDIRLGFELVQRLGAFDVGQGVVIADGRVVAIEGAEGTDAMLARVAVLRGAPTHGERARRGVLVKRPKPGQELRVDLPAIGPETVSRIAAAGLSGIAVQAGRTLAASRQELAQRADAAAIFVYGAYPVDPGEARAAPTSLGAAARLPPLGRFTPSARDQDDASRGAAIVRALEPWGVGECVVVARRHVLAVDAGEGVASTIARAGALRQWGRARGPVGLAVLAQGTGSGPAAVEAARTARLAGIMFLTADPPPGAVEAADRSGLFIVATQPAGRAS